MSAQHPAARIMRRNLLKLLAAGSLASASLPSLIGQTLAAGSGAQRKQGIYRLDGEVRFNGKVLRVGDVPTLPLSVVTGPRSLLVFVLGADAYLMRSNSHLMLTAGKSEASSRADSIRLLTGKLLSVFEKGERKLSTVTAVAGIRGTGIYMESEAERSYLCLCYGQALIGPVDQPEAAEMVKTTHHESPRWVFRDRMEAAKVINHTDDELVMLESLAGRLPPFYNPWSDGDDVLCDLAKKRY